MILLMAEALSEKPCADLGSPTGKMPGNHVYHLMGYTAVCPVNTHREIYMDHATLNMTIAYAR